MAAWPEQVLGDAGTVARGRGVRRADRRAGPQQLAGPEAAADRRARRAGRLPGHRALRVLARGSGQPAPGRLGAAPAAARAHRRRVVAGVQPRRIELGGRRPGGRNEAAGHGTGTAPASAATGAVRRVPVRPGRGTGGGARDRVRPVGAARGGGDPAAGRARRSRRLGGHRAAPAGRRRRLDGRAHRHARREQRPPARAGAGALPGRAAGALGLTAAGHTFAGLSHTSAGRRTC